MPDMRFAPPPSVRIAERSTGMNQVLARSYNERLIMSLLLQNPGLSRMQLGEASGLSAQTISVIVRSLEKDNLVLKGEAVRGRIGPPTTPISLNPEGAFSIGIHIGHRNLDVVMSDFVGNPISRRAFFYDEARLDDVRRTARAAVEAAMAEAPKARRARLAGIGLSLPSDMGPTIEEARAILDFDFEAELSRASGLDVFIQDDVTAAASAECMFGAARNLNDYLYCVVTPHIVPRLVLGGRIHAGHDQAFSGESEAAMMDRFLALRDAPEASGDNIDSWIGAVADELHALIASLGKFARVKTAIIAGLLPDAVLAEIVSRLSGISGADSETAIEKSRLGPWGLAIGAAALPFHSRFMNDSPVSAG
ncbi:ROK family transcriptional regulator [Martelella sp. AD-3]|uniref:ROK family transcriptional regulator n=1 Tax=Martelella sp. AD-3 TaxID=686597 RepID=UPI0004AE9ABA|nr:ROK family transcriptional regulator [Martelella sp. AD-3]